ncbi:MAG: hypothetical protein ABIY63_18185 [Fibrobacteria bacterium]
MITDLSSNLETNSISWVFENVTIEKEVANIKGRSVILDKTNKFVLVLHKIENTENYELIEFGGDGTEVFRINPPENHTFYYLSHHPDASVSVVCQGPPDEYGRMDYHFSINTKNGKLKLLGLAY